MDFCVSPRHLLTSCPDPHSPWTGHEASCRALRPVRRPGTRRLHVRCPPLGASTPCCGTGCRQHHFTRSHFKGGGKRPKLCLTRLLLSGSGSVWPAAPRGCHINLVKSPGWREAGQEGQLGEGSETTGARPPSVCHTDHTSVTSMLCCAHHHLLLLIDRDNPIGELFLDPSRKTQTQM